MMPSGIGMTNSFPANKEIIDNVLRIKMYKRYIPSNKQRLSVMESFGYDFRYIKAGNYPDISEYPEDFLLYAFKNSINLSELCAEGNFHKPIPGLKRIEMCLHAEVMAGVFHLRLADYEEVEPGWYCISSRELDQ